MSRTGVAVAGLVLVVGACTSGSQAPVTRVDTQYGDSAAAVSPSAGPADCNAAGGLCELGAVCQVPGFEGCGPGGAQCCFDFCLPGAAPRSIEASSFDQSCATDSDCVAVGLGDACSACELLCPNAAINVGSEPQYKAYVARSAAGAPGVACACPSGPSTACCNSGTCSVNCQNPLPPVDGATEGGGDATTDAGDTGDASAE
jgi:hypothetical protein